MKRLAFFGSLLVAGVAAAVAWGAAPPVVIGPSVPMTAAGTATTTAASSTTTGTPTPSPLTPTALLAASSSHPGARPVSLSLRLRYAMQCGSPGTGALVVDLPPQMRLPSSLPSGSALLDGKQVAVTRASGSVLRIKLPPRPAVMCDVIGLGTLTLVLTKTADIGNPASAGSYAVRAQVAGHLFRTTLTLTA